MALPDWFKHMFGGTLLIGAAGHFTNKYLERKEGLTEQQKKTILGATLGSVGGGVAGYYIGEKVIDGRMPDGRKKKMLGALVGAAGGGIAGYYIGRKAVASASRASETKDANQDYDPAMDNNQKEVH
ncbi:MAG TPA: glycine zipper 2TM domain-containing protein [Candidatus Nanoarchaeia archaeon]|nr:glycine zipper 2TM domain-containing protein [Candidatus Nanoarchaeia archaeon]